MTLLPNENLDDGWDVASGLEEDVVVNMPTSFEAMAPERPIPSGRGVLSAEEIQALLRPDLSDMDEAEADEPAPEDVSPVELHTLEPASEPAIPSGEYDSEAQATDLLASLQRIAARLSLALRQSSGLRAAVTVRDVAAQKFDESVASLNQARGQDRGQAYACFTDDTGEVVAMLCISGGLAGHMIESACGGTNGQSPLSRALTPIDIALLEALVRPVGQAIAPKLSFARIETDSEFAASVVGPIDACTVDLNLRLHDDTLPARLILCETLLLPELVRSPKAPAAPVAAAPVTETHSDAPKQVAPSGMTAVMTARIASLSVPLSRLTDLKVGSTLLLGVPVDQPVALLSGGREGALVAEGRIGRKGNRMALRITSRGPLLRQG